MKYLAIRLGAMGDVIHTLPAITSLKRTFPESRIAWAIEPRWSALLQGNPYIDQVIEIDRRALRLTYERVRAPEFEVAIDFQGLFKSAAVAFFSGAPVVFGFDQTRERSAAVFYTRRVETAAVHVVDRNLELALACGARTRILDFPLPPGIAEGQLPNGSFVLANPLAGWRGKGWPLDYYGELARMLDVPLVLNGPPSKEAELRKVKNCQLHLSSVAGLIYATRCASAVIGIDSGPMHLAAALGKPGVAIFGPTDPARNGPYGGSLRVLRAAGAEKTYKRRDEIDPSMRAVTPADVVAALGLVRSA